MCILSVSKQLTDKVLLMYAFFFLIKGMEKLLSSENNVAPGLTKGEGRERSVSPG